MECSQLDKENSHFIIADITIAAFELIKTQELADGLDPKAEVAAAAGPSKQMASKTRATSSGIRINNPNNYLTVAKHLEPHSNLASPRAG